MNGEEKHATCRNRSKEIHDLEGSASKGCGSCFKGEEPGYFCWHFGIPNIKPEACGVCAYWAPRDKVFYEEEIETKE